MVLERPVRLPERLLRGLVGLYWLGGENTIHGLQ
jgi:hypothetical protein